ncbi:MAG TPA: hypothetical protein DIT47_02820 [Flavobacteriaceae bacterium]|jgi:hypothetical protein|nr:hypothetical protein [Flavobacteriaceae bacterium]
MEVKKIDMIQEILNSTDYQILIISLMITFFSKLLIGKEEDIRKVTVKYFNYFISYILPFLNIIYINFSPNIENTKFTTTLILISALFVLATYLEKNLRKQYKMIGEFAKSETDKIKMINDFNNIQIEKIKAMNDNQKYILDELSRINDRIIKYFSEK